MSQPAKAPPATRLYALPPETSKAKAKGARRLHGLQVHPLELERQNQELRKSETNFRAFFEALGDMIVITDTAGRIVFTNQTLVRKLGYSAKELTRMTVLDLHPADLRHEAERTFAAMLQGEMNVCPLPLAAKCGTQIPVETRVWLGQWSGSASMFGLCKDLSVEQEAQQRFERLFRNNPALMALSILPEQIFVDVNDSFLKTLGFSKGDVVGRTSAELGLFPNPKQQAMAAARLLSEGRIIDIDLQVRGKDGRLLDGLFSGEAISSQGRQYFLTVMLDVTARRQVEAAENIRRLNAELEERVRQRTATIRRLHTDLTLAEQRERSRVSMILHENLQQLMVGAKFLLQNAVERLPEEDRKRIARVDQILSDSVQVVRNLAVELSPPILRDEGLAATLKWLGQWMLENYGLAVRVRVGTARKTLSEELSVILYQVVRELLFNVVKHAKVKAADVSMEQAGGQLRIAVSDAGVGFSPNNPQLWASPANTLGLMSVRERLALLDGQLDVESAPGRGCRISLRVPLTPTRARALEQAGGSKKPLRSRHA
jgi:PAS domain S-box-containing protein